MYGRLQSKRFYVLLVLLVLGQEFNHVLVANALTNHHGNRAMDKDEDQERVVNGDVIVKAGDEIDRCDPKSMDKRFLPALLFGVSIVTALVNVGIDIAMKKKGCCAFYPSICRDVSTYNRIKTTVGRYMKVNNILWKHVNILKKWIEWSNDKNAKIWLEIQRIDDLQKKIVEILGPDIMKKFNAEENKLKQSIEANNRTVLGLSYQQLSDRLNDPFNSAEDTAMRLSGITGLVGVKIATSAFKSYKIRQISKMLHSSYGAKLTKAAPAARKFFGLSKTSLNMHIQQTSKSMYKARFTGSSAGKLMRGAGAIMSVASIAMDVYSIVQKIKGCQQVRDRAKEGVRDIVQAEQRSRNLYIELMRYRKDLFTKGVSFIKAQLISSDLRTILENFRDMATSAPKEASDFRVSATFISHFLSHIHVANIAQTPRLQLLLLYGGLKKISVYYQCYLSKLQMVKYVTDNCMIGTSSMQDLFNRGNNYFHSNSDFCRIKNGMAYTSFNSVKQIVSSDVQEKGLNPDCIMNSQSKKNEVCQHKNSGYNTQQIASKTGLSVKQVEVITKACPEAPITPADVTKICDLRKKFGASDEQISKVTGISVGRLATVKC